MDKPGGDRYQGRYFSYLLRLWQEEGASHGWRASLESADASGRTGFSNLEALFEYLRRITAGQGSAMGDKEVMIER